MNRRKSRSGVKIGMLCILLWLFGGGRNARGEGVRVVSSSEQGVVIDLDLGLPRHVDGGIRLDLPAGRGMTILQGNEGRSPLPRLFLNVGVLPGRRVSLRITPLEAAIPFPLPPDGKGGLPKCLGEIGDIVFFGHLKIARVRVNPFLPEGERLHFYRRLRLSLDFTDPVPTERRIPAQEAARPFAALYDAAVVNPSERWLGRVETQGVETSETEGETVLDIFVEETGFHELDLSAMEEAGFPITDPSHLQLFRGGEPVAIEETPSAIRFYGEAPQDPFLRFEVYRLVEGDAPGLRIGTVDGTPHDEPRLETFPDTLHFEENREAHFNVGLGEKDDNWFWSRIGGNESTFRLELPPFDEDAPARLRITARGETTDQNSMTEDHRIAGEIGGFSFTSFGFDGLTEATVEFPLDPGVLVEGENLLRIRAAGENEAVVDRFFLNHVEIDLSRRFVAEGDELRFVGEGGAHRIAISGFTGNELFLYDISDPDHPRRVEGSEITAQGGEKTLTFATSGEESRSYLALSRERMRRPPRLRLAIPSTLTLPSNQADYLIITPRDFRTGAERIALFHRERGLSVKVIDVEEIYDTFSFGRKTPRAIAAFLRYAFEEWLTPVPSYVLLVGDGHFDFKNYQNTNVPNYIPPDLVPTQFLKTVSDNVLVAVSGVDLVPDMAIGRLPVNTAEELEAITDKIFLYELNGNLQPFVRRVILVSDNADAAGDFENESNALAQRVPPSHETEKIYLSQQGEGTHDEILSAWNGGGVFLNYLGHGNTEVWAHEQIFTRFDVPALQNGLRLPLLLTLNCLNGYFIIPSPSSDALAELLLATPSGGVIGAFSPSGLSTDFAAFVFDENLFRGFFEEDVREMGNLLSLGKALLPPDGIFAQIYDIFLLFGDPALRLLSPFDRDNDGVGDDEDDCPETFDPGQEDGDGDGIGDVCDPIENPSTTDETGGTSEEGPLSGEPTEGGLTSGEISGTTVESASPSPGETSSGEGGGGCCGIVPVAPRRLLPSALLLLLLEFRLWRRLRRR